MKFKLLVQSLSLLAVLTIIKNFPDCTDIIDFSTFIVENAILLVVMMLCMIWVVFAIWYGISFRAFRFTDKETGYSVVNVLEKEEAGLNFFTTLIIPLLIDEVDTIQGAATLFVIVAMICILLWRTNLFYANPVLSIFGYRVYEFSFESNHQMSDKSYIGLCPGKINEGSMVEYKPITEKVIYIKEMKK